MSETNTESKPRRVNVLLIVSLCLNIVLIPILASVVVRTLHRAGEIGGGGVLSPRSVIAAIPAEEARIQKIVDAHSGKIHALRADSLRTRMDAFAVLGSAEYRADKFGAALDRVAAADNALERESIAMMAESLAQLTPAERKVIVEIVERRNHSWFWKWFRSRELRE